jgi:hypothetical protein
MRQRTSFAATVVPNGVISLPLVYRKLVNGLATIAYFARWARFGQRK